MNTIYLDYNIMIILMEHRNLPLKQLINRLKKKKFVFPYSPAHMEEIATPNMVGTPDAIKVKKKLTFINDLSKKYELFPSKGKTILYREKTQTCYDRVVTEYYKNKPIEKNEKEMLQEYKKRDLDGKLSAEISNKPYTILSLPEFDSELCSVLKCSPELKSVYGRELNREDIDSLKNSLSEKSHDIKTQVLELAFNYLEYIRYKPEKVKKSRSRMHDCTHAIYASSASIFVSDDAKFLSKVIAIYHYFSIDTEVLGTNEFIKKYASQVD